MTSVKSHVAPAKDKSIIASRASSRVRTQPKRLIDEIHHIEDDTPNLEKAEADEHMDIDSEEERQLLASPGKEVIKTGETPKTKLPQRVLNTPIQKKSESRENSGSGFSPIIKKFVQIQSGSKEKSDLKKKERRLRKNLKWMPRKLESTVMANMSELTKTMDMVVNKDFKKKDFHKLPDVHTKLEKDLQEYLDDQRDLQEVMEDANVMRTLTSKGGVEGVMRK
uniref:Uncharacterized protein n=1 Tax=Panagrolaimus sp. JU765 TaxID=591449 RepID=A0AC34PVX5_9BILA